MSTPAPMQSSKEMPVKVLSVRQPWAWLIVNGHKDIENRTWPTRYRGLILIHASKGMTRQEYEDTADFVCGVNRENLMAGNGRPAIVLPAPGLLLRGGIVGVATLTDCLRTSDSPWHMPGCWGFRLTGARPLPFMPMMGRLGIFDIPGEIIAASSEIETG